MKIRLYGNLPAAIAAVGVLFCSSVVLADYSDDMANESAWVAQSFASGSQDPVAGSVTGEVVFECKNGTQNKCTWERAYSSPKPSLANSNALKIKLNISNVAAMSSLTVYLNLPAAGSSTSWHALSLANAYLVEGEQEIILPFNTMRPDSCSSATPPVCVKVDNLSELTKIWLNPTRRSGNTSDFTLTVDNIEAINLPVALLNNDGYTQFLKSILERYDIGYFTVDKSQLENLPRASLHPFTGAKFVMANQATLDNASQGTFIADYLSCTPGATKFIGFDPSVLQGNLRSKLGVPELASSLASIKGINAMQFTETAAGDLVLARNQPAVYSWVWPLSNGTTGGAADAIAYWVSSSTNPVTVTERPAWLLNCAGAYRDKVLTNVYHPLDNDHVLLALMMKLQPDMKAEIAGKVEAMLHDFAGLEIDDFPYLMGLIDIALQSLPESPEKEAALLSFDDAETAYATASGGTELQQLNAFLETRKHLTPAYSLLLRPEDNDEVKAIWVTNAWGPQPGNWEKPMEDVAANGFTHVAVNVASAASVSFPSRERCQPGFPTEDVLCLEENPEWLVAKSEHGSTPLQPALEDPLAAAISAAHDNGLKFIAWKKSFALSGASTNRKSWFKNNGFAQYEYYPWSTLSENIDAATPCSDLVRQLDLDLISEVATDYDVDGIQLDYIRFNSGSSSFDAKCQAGFAAYLTTITPSLTCTWPAAVNEAVSTSPACVAAYKTFKKNLITAHVSEVATLIQNINDNRPTGKPEIELSVAVFPVGNQEVAQDWPAWTGYRDLRRMFPMTYYATMADFKAAVKGAHAQLPLNSTFPLHFGLGGFETTADIIVAQIQWLREQENEEDGFTHTGFSFFELNRDSQENMLPLISGSIAFPDQDGDGVRDDSDDCPYHANTSVCPHGLAGSYFDSLTPGGTPAATRIDSEVDFNWDMDSPIPGTINDEDFSVSWEGIVVPPVTGTYEFCTNSDDGVKLRVNDDLIIDKWIDQAVEEWCGTIELKAHKPVPISLEFYDTLEEAVVQLRWSYPGQTQPVIVPTSALYAQ